MSKTSNSPLSLTNYTNFINPNPKDAETNPPPNIIKINYGKNYDGNFDGANYLESIFNKNKFLPFPQVKNNEEQTTITGPGLASNQFHKGGDGLKNNTDDNYDISTSDLIDFTKGKGKESMRLKESDFIYLKNLGVYPNNRLIIARRFPAPVGNDLYAVKTEPIATLIDWVKEDGDFFNMTFGEDWISAKGAFTDILNDMGKDLTLSQDNANGMGRLGNIMGAGLNAIPLPGMMEALQYKLFNKLGLVSGTFSAANFLLPSGDPNLIKQAMRRATVEKGQAGSGLKSSFEIKMSVEYELKYINGVDPTVVYFDILANILSFATSDARFMFNGNFDSKGKDLLNQLISGDVGSLINAMTTFINTLKEVMHDLVDGAKTFLASKKEVQKNNDAKDKPWWKLWGPDYKESNDSDVAGLLNSVIASTAGAVIGKYKVAIIGVLAALTGKSSTPWHVTIGNPKRPYFSSGDLWTDSVSLSMGPVLGFNDLPTSIKAEFTLKPARNLGADEIFTRFNTGKGRSYIRGNKDFWTQLQDDPLIIQAEQPQKISGYNFPVQDNTANTYGQQQANLQAKASADARKNAPPPPPTPTVVPTYVKIVQIAGSKKFAITYFAEDKVTQIGFTYEDDTAKNKNEAFENAKKEKNNPNLKLL